MSDISTVISRQPGRYRSRYWPRCYVRLAQPERLWYLLTFQNPSSFVAL